MPLRSALAAKCLSYWFSVPQFSNFHKRGSSLDTYTRHCEKAFWLHLPLKRPYNIRNKREECTPLSRAHRSYISTLPYGKGIGNAVPHSGTAPSARRDGAEEQCVPNGLFRGCCFLSSEKRARGAAAAVCGAELRCHLQGGPHSAPLRSAAPPRFAALAVLRAARRRGKPFFCPPRSSGPAKKTEGFPGLSSAAVFCAANYESG